jgi:hypothetical protein
MLDRRSALKGTIALAAAAVSGCHRATKEASQLDPMAALKGKIYLKGDADYEAVRQAGVWNARKPDRYPAAIVLAETDKDVIQAVRLARQNGWKVGTRSGGHSFAGTHTRDGAILINLAKLKEMRVSPDQRIAAVSPSTKGDELNNLLREKYGLMFPTAHGFGVGVGGFCMHGGHGFNLRTVGLACENLVAIDVVTPDGELIHADSKNNPDYLWAARGGGPGFFGVVTRMYLRLHPHPKMQRAAKHSFHLADAAVVSDWVHKTMDEHPNYMEMLVMGRRINGGPPQLDLFTTIHANTQEEVDRVRSLIDTCPVISRAFDIVPYVPAIFPPPVDDGFQPTGARYVVDGVWTDAGADQINPPFVEAMQSIPSDHSFVYWTPSLSRANTLRDMAYSVRGRIYISPSASYSDSSKDKEVADWVERSTHGFQPFGNGSQFNDDNSVMHQQYGIKLRYLSDASAQRMKDLLAKYDPSGMFGYIAPPV